MFPFKYCYNILLISSHGSGQLQQLFTIHQAMQRQHVESHFHHTEMLAGGVKETTLLNLEISVTMSHHE